MAYRPFHYLALVLLAVGREPISRTASISFWARRS